MTAQQYDRLSAPFRAPARACGLRLVNKLLTVACYLAYPMALLALAWTHDHRLVKAVLIPAISFVLVSAFRRVVSAPRPYEVLDITPIIHKDTRGKSFPSRHVFSVFVIAMVLLWLEPPIGILFLLMGVLLATCRVIGGVHWLRDVLAGAVIGICAGGVLFL